MRRSKSFLKIGLEVLLIGTGVFLGLMGEQWRERAQHRELAETSLRRFRDETQVNCKAVATVKDYHVTTKESLDAFLAADEKTRPTKSVRLKGIQPAAFERTAWDLALVTQALTYIDAPLAFTLSRSTDSPSPHSTADRSSSSTRPSHSGCRAPTIRKSTTTGIGCRRAATPRRSSAGG